MKMDFGLMYVLLLLLFAHCELLLGNTPDNNQDITPEATTVEGDMVEGDMVEGDMILNAKQLEQYFGVSTRETRAVTMVETAKWPGGIVAYDLSPNLSSNAINVIMAAIQQLMRDTCITFKRREPADYDHVYFFPGPGCISHVGRQGGRQNVSIGPMCEYVGVVIHEIFHALGRWHEHSRPDRNSYVKVNHENILPDKDNNFRIIKGTSTQNLPYDFDSIMHYDGYAFSSNGEPTIQPLNTTIPLTRIGQRGSLSELDAKHIEALYCKGYSGQWSVWGVWSTCSTSCGAGYRQRTRTCLTPSCQGRPIATESCNRGNCPIVSSWGDWTSWSACSTTCGRGQRIRVRQCVGGKSCEGRDSEMEDCSRPCGPEWGEWGEWSVCSSTCEGGVSTRVRACLSYDGSCTGLGEEQSPCNVDISCSEPPINCEDFDVICSSSRNLLNFSFLLFILFLNWLCTQR